MDEDLEKQKEALKQFIEVMFESNGKPASITITIKFKDSAKSNKAEKA